MTRFLINEQSDPSGRSGVIDHFVVSFVGLLQRVRLGNDRFDAAQFDEAVQVIVHELEFILRNH